MENLFQAILLESFKETSDEDLLGYWNEVSLIKEPYHSTAILVHKYFSKKLLSLILNKYPEFKKNIEILPNYNWQ